MTTILFAFIIAFVLSLVLTPGATWLGKRFGAVDMPSERKVHTRAIPRSGGLAILVSSFLTIVVCIFLATEVSDLLVWNQKRLFGFLGGFVIFAVGFYDDFHRLEPRIKFLFQVFAATIAFYGGIRIEAFVIEGATIHFGLLSWAVTVFWFLLLINAVNLIDGLDGLAAGVAFFTSTVMVILAVMQVNYLAALEFAVLAGVLLGFLRYNFNPASVFLGDGGSYFIGYAIAALSIIGSVKSQLGATLLIPLLALGVPIFDTILAPVRRWVLGQRLFRPDKGHIHHRLVARGLTSKKAVLLLYGVSCILCALGILLINLRNETASLLLVLLGATAFIAVRKMGYLEYLAVDKIYGWLRDLSDETGLSRNRRSFLSLQIEMEQAKNLDELWEGVCRALEMLRLDRGELHIRETKCAPVVPSGNPRRPLSDRGGDAGSRGERRRGSAKAPDANVAWRNKEKNDQGSVLIWTRGHHRRREDGLDDGLFRVEIPLGAGNPIAAKLVLIKDLRRESIQPYTLRRIEYLHRSVTTAMTRLKIGK